MEYKYLLNELMQHIPLVGDPAATAAVAATAKPWEGLDTPKCDITTPAGRRAVDHDLGYWSQHGE